MIKFKKMEREDIILSILVAISICTLIVGISMATSKTFNSINEGVIVYKKYIPEMQGKAYKKDGKEIVEYVSVHVPEYIFTIRNEKKISYSEREIYVTQSEYNKYEIGDYYIIGDEK